MKSELKEIAEDIFRLNKQATGLFWKVKKRVSAPKGAVERIDSRRAFVGSLMTLIAECKKCSDMDVDKMQNVLEQVTP